MLSARPARAGCGCWSTPAWPTRAARAAGAAAGGRRAPPAQGRLRAHADRAGAGDGLETEPTARCPGPTWSCGWPRCCTTSASRRRAASSPAAGSRFHHHEVVGAKLAAKRLQGAAVRQGRRSRTCPGWSSCTCGSTATATGEWTDSAVRRYVTDAGPLLTRLHRLTRVGLHDPQRRTARGPAVRGVRRPGGADRAAAPSRRSWPRSGRTWTATRSWPILGIGPGREVGAAYRHLLELRLERGPLGRDAGPGRAARGGRTKHPSA